jgi:hypothetical protein
MNKFLNEYLLVTIVLLALFITVGIVYSFESNRVDYNMNPDISSKNVGSDCFQGLRMPAKNLDALLQPADLVVVGKVVSDGVTKTKSLKSNTGTNPLDIKFSTLFPDKELTFDVTQVKIQIENVILGDKDIKEITFSQLGHASSNNYQTKVKKNQKLLFILKKNADDGAYSSVDFEDGLFLISKEQKVLSLSKNITVAKYDGLILENLIKDIANIVNRQS